MNTAFTKGDVYIEVDDDFHTAEINKPDHSGVICCYGEGEESAQALRDKVFLCLSLHEELVQALGSVMDTAVVRHALAGLSKGFGTKHPDGIALNTAVAVIAKAEAR